MKAPFKWEEIERSEDIATARAKVEGGWLVNHVVYPCDQESLMVMTTTFVPDQQHQWIVENISIPSLSIYESSSNVVSYEDKMSSTGGVVFDPYKGSHA